MKKAQDIDEHIDDWSTSLPRLKWEKLFLHIASPYLGVTRGTNIVHLLTAKAIASCQSWPAEMSSIS